MRTAPPARGQTLVLFALTLLLTTLLVLMTLGISTRVKEKMEVQAVADAAAYSNAAITARTYNEIALMSRAQIGKMVSLSAVQSLISWSSYYRGQVEASRQSYEKARKRYDDIEKACCKSKSPCKAMCACAKKAILDINLERQKLAQHQQALKSRADDLDQDAAAQARLLQGAATTLYGAQTERWLRLQGKLDDQSVAEDIVKQARLGSRWPGEWSAPGSGDEVTKDEALLLGALLPVNVFNGHHLYAGMGSRGFSFVTGRQGGERVLTSKLQSLVSRPDAIVATNKGSAYFAGKLNHGQLLPSGEFSWADDHSGGGEANRVTFMRGAAPCPRSSSGSTDVKAELKSTDSRDETDKHTWSPGGSEPDKQRHTLGRCIGDCPGIWPMFVDYNFVRLFDKGDNQGQPKNHAVIQRDYRARPASAEPWALLFRFPFTRGAPSRWDGRGIQLGSHAGDVDISKQTALSTGIAYYHRHGHWQEPPNLLNPFWRATLVPFDVDKDGRDDVKDTLHDVGVDWAADAFEALEAQGYKGGP